MAVILGDRWINEVQADVSSVITAAIATQPAIRDLRVLLTLDHVTYELERMGVMPRQSQTGSQARPVPAA